MQHALFGRSLSCCTRHTQTEPCLQELEQQLQPTQVALERVRTQWAAAQVQVPDLQQQVASLQQRLASESNATRTAKAALANTTQGVPCCQARVKLARLDSDVMPTSMLPQQRAVMSDSARAQKRRG